MFPKRLLALMLFAALAVMPPCVLRAQWQPTNGLYGGGFSSVVENRGVLFGDFESSGIFRSTDHGVTWSPANKGLLDFVGNLVSDGTHVFIGSDYEIYMWSDDSMAWVARTPFGGPVGVVPIGAYKNNLYGCADGVYRSRDSGLTWTPIDSGLSANSSVTSFAVVDSFIFIGIQYGGFFRTSDNGDHWTELDSGTFPPQVFCLVTIGTDIFAGSYHGMIHSTDYGLTWPSCDNGLPPQNISVMAVLGSTLVVSVSSMLYVSTDSGTSWRVQSYGLIDGFSAMTFVGDTLLTSNYWGIFLSIDTGRTWISAYNVVSIQTNTLLAQGPALYAGGETFYRSTDSGMNWSIPVYKVWLDSLYTLGSITSLVSQGRNIYAASSGIFLTTDSGATWTLRENGLPEASIECLAVEGSNLFAGTYGHGVFLSTDSGASWSTMSNGLPANCSVMSLCVAGNDIVAGLENAVGSMSGVFLSNDNGETWISHNDGFPTYSQACTLVASIDTVIFADMYSGGGLFRSSINDTAWVHLPIGMSSFAKVDSIIFVGGNGIFESFDNGDNWIEIDSGIIDPDILSLAVDDSMLFVGTNNESTNYPPIPTIWRRPISELTTSPYILGASADTLNFGNIPVGTDGLRIATVTNDGKSAITIQSFQLTPLQEPFTTSDLSSEVELNPGESFTFEVFFMPTQPGVFSATIRVASEAKAINIVLIGAAGGVAGVEQQSQLPSILSAAPNPFSQSTEITFTSPSAGYADISIVNMLGVEVARLFSGELGAGEHNFSWDAGKDAYATQGMYECLIRMNGQVEALPVVLMK